MLDRLRRLAIRHGALARLTDGTTEEPTYECQDCETELAAQRQACPECGGYHIERTEW